MLARFGERLSQAWYTSAYWPLLLAPLSLIYSLALHLISFFRTPPSPSAVPVIVVGNITAGGTGKSPLVSYLVRCFESKGLRAGIVSRGYGIDIPRGELRLVSLDSEASHVGDEPLMLKRLLGCDIALCPQRSVAVAALESIGVDVVISDDGLQHHAMYRDIELCVVDSARGLGNQWLLPVGPLREPKSRLASVDTVVFNGASSPKIVELSDFLARHHVITSRMELVPHSFINVDTGMQLSVEQFKRGIAEKQLSAVAAIGNPQRFFDTLDQLNLDVRLAKPFPDHYAFSASDFGEMRGVIVMTEKDAAKCSALGLKDAWFLRVQPELQDKLGDRLYNQLVEKNRLNPSL